MRTLPPWRAHGLTRRFFRATGRRRGRTPHHGGGKGDDDQPHVKTWPTNQLSAMRAENRNCYRNGRERREAEEEEEQQGREAEEEGRGREEAAPAGPRPRGPREGRRGRGGVGRFAGVSRWDHLTNPLTQPAAGVSTCHGHPAEPAGRTAGATGSSAAEDGGLEAGPWIASTTPGLEKAEDDNSNPHKMNILGRERLLRGNKPVLASGDIAAWLSRGVGGPCGDRWLI